jgi:threonine dehydratase
LVEVGVQFVNVHWPNRMISEGAGAYPVTCALAGQAGRGKVVCMVSAGNIDLRKLCIVLNGQDLDANPRR